MKKIELFNDEMEFDFEKDISINKFHLDEECLSHSSIYARYAEAQAEAKTEVSSAKDNLDLIKSERNIAIRKSLSDSKEKVTEAMITSYLETDEKVIKAKEKVRKAEDVYGKLSVAVSAFEHRKSELDNLVKLYNSGYFSAPTSSSEIKKNMNEQTSKAMRRSLNK